MIRKRDISLGEDYIDDDTERKMRAVTNDKKNQPESDLIDKGTASSNESIEIKPQLNTILLDDGEGGTFKEAKERMRRVYELKHSEWYKKLEDLFSKYQEEKSPDQESDQEFIVPEDCPEEIGEFFIKDMLAHAQEQGLEGSVDIVKKADVIAETATAETAKDSRVQKDNGPKNLEHPHGLIASYLSNLYIQGMEPYQMRWAFLFKTEKEVKDRLDQLASQYSDFAEIRNKIKDEEWIKEVNFFLKQLERGRGRTDGYDPAQEFLTKVLIQQPKLKYEQLNAQDIEESNKKVIEATRQVWENFVYSGEWEYSKDKGYQLKDTAGFDAKVSLFLLEQAGMIGAKQAQAAEPGKIKFGATNIDTQPTAGVRLEPTVRIGNNPEGRTLVETSSAKIIWRLLTSAGLLDKKDEALRVMAEIAVDDDNGHLIANKQQFKNSPYTFRGLAKGFAAPEMYSYITKQWQKLGGEEVSKIGNWPERQQAQEDIYRKLLDYKLTRDEIKEHNLTKNQSQLIERFRYTDKILNQSKEKLEQGGRVIDTKYGRYIVSINKWWPKGEQYLAGHEGARAYGYDGVIIYDPFHDSFKVNSVKPKVDLSREWKLPQGRPDKGIMVTSYGEPLRVSLKDIFNHLDASQAVEKPQGYLKEFLGLEEQINQLLAEQKSAITDHCRKLYQGWPQEAQAVAREERELEIYNLYQETLSEVRKQIYNEYIGKRSQPKK